VFSDIAPFLSPFSLAPSWTSLPAWVGPSPLYFPPHSYPPWALRTPRGLGTFSIFHTPWSSPHPKSELFPFCRVDPTPRVLISPWPEWVALPTNAIGRFPPRLCFSPSGPYPCHWPPLMVTCRPTVVFFPGKPIVSHNRHQKYPTSVKLYRIGTHRPLGRSARVPFPRTFDGFRVKGSQRTFRL